MRCLPRCRVAFPLLALGLAVPAAAGAEVVALLPVTGANVDAGTLEAARDVFRSHLEKAGHEVRLAQADPSREPTPLEAAAAARSVGAGHAAVVRLVALGGTLRARLAVHDAAGRTVHTDDIAGATPADLDPMLQRLAQGWAARSTAAAVAEIDTVTDREVEALKKRRSTRHTGLRIGAVLPIAPRRPAGAGIGFSWLYDARSFALDVTWDFWGASKDLSGASASHFDTSLGLAFTVPLLRTDMTPYVGGGMRYAIARYDGDWGAGLRPQIVGGLWMGRLSTTQVRIEASWFHDLFPNAGRDVQGVGLHAAAFF